VTARTIVTRDQHEAALAALVAEVRDPQTGLFGPDSLTWALGGDVAIFAGGGRAALLQLAHPFVAYAIDQHSDTRADVGGRFQRTFHHVFAMVFGTLDEALASARRVHAIHARIAGVIERAHGAWPAGTRYAANDADALRWVHATLVDTTLAVHARLGTRLGPTDRDRYVVEMNRFAALFGVPRALWPASYADHAAYMARMFESGELAVAPCAREMAAFLLGRGDGARQPVLGRFAEATTAALLPPPLASAFELASRAQGERYLAAFARVHRLVPLAIRTMPAHAAARRRISGAPPARFDAWRDRALVALSRRVSGSSSDPGRSV